MKLVTIEYSEFKRLVAQEVHLKARVAELENEVDDLEAKNYFLENELESHQTLEDDEEEELLDE
ncbi:hypothetical protein DOS77_11865 [Staphylococcus felis]|uniref:hypothetical protein n=1 Tax=Staphylococcus felis TaxID=46127 RepID=UPI000E2830D0|nr:hypothetical protein [Staphylococcus felis]REI11773.1 hypothetical protein DOS66_03600 [Staphylococcus felis]REI19609.1 hypothetical protein DOS77_11865 [Staphylococcus felis]REI32752.1 hypothetical protein DOS82_09375 [Staphylococcus felis]